MKTYLLAIMLISNVSYAEIVYVNPANTKSSSKMDFQYSLGFTHYDINAVGNTKDSVKALSLGADLQTQSFESFDFYYGLKSQVQLSPVADKLLVMPTLALKVGLPIYINEKLFIGVTGFVGTSYVYFKQEQKTWSQVNELNGFVLNYGYAGEASYEAKRDVVIGVKVEINKVLINSNTSSTMQGITPSLTLRYSF